jgi:hypothetical protein
MTIKNIRRQHDEDYSYAKTAVTARLACTECGRKLNVFNMFDDDTCTICATDASAHTIYPPRDGNSGATVSVINPFPKTPNTSTMAIAFAAAMGAQG